MSMKKQGAACLAAVLLAGCVTDPYTGESKMSGAAKGGLIGTAGGALAGVATAYATGNKKDALKGALIGAAGGAVVGAGIGLYMDQQDKALREELRGTGVSVTKLDDKTIILNMPGDITFLSGSADLSQNFFAVLNSVAKVLNKFDKTSILVSGHTDSTGSAATNQALSYNRATTVANYLIGQKTKAPRFTTQGFGSSNPVASNSTAAGRAANRRVEIKLIGTE